MFSYRLDRVERGRVPRHHGEVPDSLPSAAEDEAGQSAQPLLCVSAAAASAAAAGASAPAAQAAGLTAGAAAAAPVAAAAAAEAAEQRRRQQQEEEEEPRLQGQLIETRAKMACVTVCLFHWARKSGFA